MYAQLGDTQACFDNARALIEKSSNTELQALAALAAASVTDDAQEKIDWLSYAEKSGGTAVKRGLASAYAQLAMSQTGAARTSAAERSIQYYKEIISSGYYSEADMINYSMALHLNGQLGNAIQVLEQILPEYSEDYRVKMYLAFYTFEAGDNPAASDYCQSALEAWRRDMSPNREPESSENIQKLLALAEKFGL